ncbi:MAG: SDR family NAD(P)-dependent oxidoreductase [Sphaerochaetaceae bacterium]|jgi:short-subunit dehydrogenase|nr:SDR family NAD(P)-dependent oxidoreductase [Sphaerochaetaceae bacterium]NLO59977.1 SDR family NAD(P)-dependent oxidoreductase [Spirochaetales bacterium]MDD2405093.1 SDR family NAD(P)-dependent oxidoreductase [Sphaerochaetaceae bacterium]MDD4258986.1 SDR family NAD(P)-dependent oxidoreductase [Sphaerochaetaceae bacterium]MDD5075730.1 SDR family NAD(P)-dependent oxidoreductase [Sphaerochaetaceae bacterium]
MKRTSLGQDSVVLVTGGNKGIGKETAREFCKLGCFVYICGRDKTTLEATKEEFLKDHYSIEALECDIRDYQSCSQLIATVITQKGRLDVLVNNAGMSMRGSIEASSCNIIEEMMKVNYLGPVALTHYAIGPLKKSRGSIVFISSLTALHGLPEVGPYGAAKLALKNLSESLRAELYQDDVHVGILHVGFTDFDSGKVIYDNNGKLIPLKRAKNHQTRNEVARQVLVCVRRRKKEMTLTALGKTASFLYRHFPRTSDALVCKLSAKKFLVGN